MARDRRGRFTAERTTRTTETIERVTVEDDTLTDLPLLGGDELNWAQGWDPGPIHPHSGYLAQRAGQRDQALGLLVLYAQSTPPGEAAGWVVRQAVNILRAGPNASPLELTLGRSI